MNIGTLTGAITLEDQMSGALTTAISKVQQFGKTWSGVAGAVAVGAGVMASAITGAVYSIVSLGEKGSVINGVEDSFNRLAAAAGSTGEAMIGGLTQGVRGTIDSMELMQSTTRLLADNVRLSADDMRVMGAVAREMGKATGTDAAGGLNTLSQALLTGNIRSLRRFGINVDLVQSEKDFARSLGTTRDQLSAAGVLESHRIAILEGMRQKLNTLGESQLSFKERVQQATVAIGNWFDDLAKGVARSAAVNRAFDTIAQSISNAFGGTSQSLLQNLLAGVDRFANAVTRFGPPVINAIKSIQQAIIDVVSWLSSINDRFQITNTIVAGVRTAWSFLTTAFYFVRDAVRAVMDAWARMPEWLQRLTESSVKLGAGLVVAGVAMNAMSTPLVSLVDKIDKTINIFGNFTSGVFSVLGIVDRWGGGLTLLSARYAQLTASILANNTISTAAAFTYNSVTVALVFWQTALEASLLRLGQLTAAMGLNTAVAKIQTVATGILTTAKSTLASIVLATSVNFNVLAARLGLATVATKIHTLATGILTSAKTALAGVLLATTLNLNIFTARLGVASLSAAAGGVAMLGLGSAVLALQYVLLPVIAAFAGWKLGPIIGDWIGLSDQIEYASLRLQRWLGLIDQHATDSDLWNSVQANTARRAGDTATAYDEAAEAAKHLREEEQRRRDALSGATIDAGIQTLLKDYQSLSREQQFNIDVMKRVGQQAEVLRQQGGQLGPVLTFMADQYVALNRVLPPVTDGMLKQSTVFDDFTKKAQDMVRSFQAIVAVGTDVDVFSQAFRGLNPELLKNVEIQRMLVPEIDKLANAHRVVTPQMMAVRDAALATRLALQAKDAAVLASVGLTQSQIDHMKTLGLSEDDIARKYGVTTEAIGRRSTALQEAAEIEQNLASFSFALVKQQEEAAKRREVMELAANKAIGESTEELNDFIRKDTLSTTNYQIDQIEREAAERMAAFSLSGASAQQIKEFNDLQTSLSRRRVMALKVDNDALKSHSRQTLDEIAARAKATYEAMLADPANYSRATIIEFKKIADEAKKAADVTRTVWDDVWGGLKDTLRTIPDLISQAFTGGGGLIGAFKALGTQLAKAIMDPLRKEFEAFATTAQKIALGISSGLASIIGGALGGGTGAAIGGMAASMTMLAAKAGVFGASLAGSAVAAGALSLGIGAAAVGVFALIKYFFGVSKEVKEMRAAVADFEKQLHGTLTQAQLIESQGVDWKKTVIGVRDAYLLVGKTAGEAEKAVTALWDTGNPARSRAAAQEIAINVALSQNVKAVRAMVQEYVGAGTKIPPALQANIDKLVIMGKLTADNAKEMLNLVQTSVPAYADVQAAAERYGIQVGALGNAVQGLRITEIANQMVTDFNLMELAGADMNVVMAGMRDEILNLITDAAKFGTALPAALKPIIERMDLAGLFTDEFGNKLVDVSNLTFAETLVDKVQKLVDAMLELVNVIKGDVGGALDELGRTKIPPIRVPVIIERQGDFVPDIAAVDQGVRPEVVEPVYAAAGFRVQASNVIPFQPRGTDTVPAMVTPGERILSVAENHEYEGRNSQPIEVNVLLDGKVIARNQTRHFPKTLRRAGNVKR
jgi:hypothetical protein